jgi:hypothetical protein
MARITLQSSASAAVPITTELSLQLASKKDMVSHESQACLQYTMQPTLPLTHDLTPWPHVLPHLLYSYQLSPLYYGLHMLCEDPVLPGGR